MYKITNLAKKIRMLIIIKIVYRNVLEVKRGFTCGRGTVFYAKEKISIGENVYVGKYCSIETDTVIGNNVLIGNLVGIVGRYDHNYSQVGVPIKKAQWIGDINYDWKGKNQCTRIEDDVWIGFNATILSGIKIGRGAVIGAGSVVTKDVEPYSIVVGNPAKKVKMRFNEEEAAEHERSIYI